jgi:hypothetical protein
MLTGQPDRDRDFDLSGMKQVSLCYLRIASNMENNSKVYLQMASDLFVNFPQETIVRWRSK